MNAEIRIILKTLQKNNNNNKVCKRFLKEDRRKTSYNYFYLLKELIILYRYRFERNIVFYVFDQYIKAIDINKYHLIVNILEPESNDLPL